MAEAIINNDEAATSHAINILNSEQTQKLIDDTMLAMFANADKIKGLKGKTSG